MCPYHEFIYQAKIHDSINLLSVSCRNTNINISTDNTYIYNINERPHRTTKITEKKKTWKISTHSKYRVGEDHLKLVG